MSILCMEPNVLGILSSSNFNDLYCRDEGAEV